MAIPSRIKILLRVFLSVVLILPAFYTRGQTVQINDAKFISQDVPASVGLRQEFTARITFENTGTTTWTAAGLYRLGSQNPQDNNIWRDGRVRDQANNIAPGQRVTFSFTNLSWSEPGIHNFQWRMLQDGMEWFGEETPNLEIHVGDPSQTYVLAVSQGGRAGQNEISIYGRNLASLVEFKTAANQTFSANGTVSADKTRTSVLIPAGLPSGVTAVTVAGSASSRLTQIGIDPWPEIFIDYKDGVRARDDISFWAACRDVVWMQRNFDAGFTNARPGWTFHGVADVIWKGISETEAQNVLDGCNRGGYNVTFPDDMRPHTDSDRDPLLRALEIYMALNVDRKGISCVADLAAPVCQPYLPFITSGGGTGTGTGQAPIIEILNPSQIRQNQGLEIHGSLFKPSSETANVVWFYRSETDLIPVAHETTLSNADGTILYTDIPLVGSSPLSVGDYIVKVSIEPGAVGLAPAGALSNSQPIRVLAQPQFEIRNTTPGWQGDIAYNSRANNWLVVSKDASGGSHDGVITGQIMSNDGRTAGSQFDISRTNPVIRGGVPRAVFNPKTQKYLVVWSTDAQAVRNPGSVMGRFVTAKGKPSGNEFLISRGLPGFIGVEGKLWFDSSKNKFILAVNNVVENYGDRFIKLAIISTAGRADKFVTISPATTHLAAASIAGNPQRGTYCVVYVQQREGDLAGSFVKKFNIGSRSVGGEKQLSGLSNLPGSTPSIEYNPNSKQYLTVWSQAGNGTFARLVNEDCAPIGEVFSVGAQVYGPQITYNPKSKIFGVIGERTVIANSYHAARGEEDEYIFLDARGHLTGSGGRIFRDFEPTGNKTPMISANTKDGTFAVISSRDYGITRFVSRLRK